LAGVWRLSCLLYSLFLVIIDFFIPALSQGKFHL
jgi:hypothetical protein